MALHTSTHRRRTGFSLLELVIVIVVIGVIGAVAVPRMSSGAEHARREQLLADTRNLQVAVDIYTQEHAGKSPAEDAEGAVDRDSARFLERLLSPTLADGTPDERGPFGRYLTKTPTNPFTVCPEIRIEVGGVPTGCAFHFDPSTGGVSPDDTSGRGGGSETTTDISGTDGGSVSSDHALRSGSVLQD
jgi:prepilin-type N-terminal cleavage/methylation domain-containing protein